MFGRFPLNVLLSGRPSAPLRKLQIQCIRTVLKEDFLQGNNTFMHSWNFERDFSHKEKSTVCFNRNISEIQNALKFQDLKIDVYLNLCIQLQLLPRREWNLIGFKSPPVSAG